MNRAACFTLLLALVSLPVAADDGKFRAAVRDAVVKEVHERKEADDNKPQDDNELPRVANVGNRSSPSRNLHNVLWGYDDSLSVATCPMDSPGAPTFDEVRTYYRNYTDNEMWKICVNRSSYPGAISGACACSLLAYPHPWRPVETTHQSEHPDEPIGSTDELEPIEPISNPGPETSEK